MEKLLNFSEPIDVNLMDNVVESLYGTDARAVCFYLPLFLLATCLHVSNALYSVWQPRVSLHSSRTTWRHGLGSIQY